MISINIFSRKYFKTFFKANEIQSVAVYQFESSKFFSKIELDV